MGDRLTIVLPVEAEAPVASHRAAPLVDLVGARIGVVDNQLWRSMPTIVDTVQRDLRARGVASIETLAFDHLSADFPSRVAELGSFASRVDGAITGLGN